jgi:hypothetical protein
MDYSKKDGGTRILDQMKARTLATGMGQTVASNRETGSQRAERVIDGIKPGQLVSDRGLHPHVKHRDAMAEEYKAANMDPIPEGPGSPPKGWPLLSGSKSHAQANGMTAPADNQSDNQGEQTRVPTTGRKRMAGAIFQTGLRRAGT